MTAGRSPTAEDRVEVDSWRLLAELALANQQLEEATENYLNAALASNDPAYAARAAQLAYELGFTTLGHQATDRWADIEPDNPRVSYFAGIFETRSGHISDAVDEFTVVLDALDEASLGTGFLLILEALISEPSIATAAAVMEGLTPQYPPTAQGHYALARLALGAGRFEIALRESERTVALAPDWPEAQLLYARTLLVSGLSDQALEIARRLAAEIDSPEVQLELAELLLSAGETEAAEAQLTEILDANPGMPDAIRALGFLYLTLEEFDAARQQFEMLRNNPDFRDETFYYLGRIAELESEYLQATRAYSRVIGGPRAVESQRRTASILRTELGNADNALRHLKDFGDANPRFEADMLLARAEMLLRLGEAERGMALINGAVERDGQMADQGLRLAHVQFYSALMTDALDRGDLVTAESLITEGLERYPESLDLLYSHSILLQEQGELRRAVRVLEDLVETQPENPTFLNGLGYLLTDKLGRHKDARRYLQRALAMSPDNAAILDSMGWALFHLGEYELALDYLERAYRAMAVGEVLAHLVDVHWALGNRTLAMEMLSDGLVTEPEDPWLLEVQDRLEQ